MMKRRKGRDSLAAGSRRRFLLGVALILVAVSSSAVAAGGGQPTALIGQPVSLVVQPDTIRLSGPRAMQQLVVTGRYSDGSERDLTPFTTLSAEVAGVVTIRPGGFLQAHKDGRTTLIIRAGPRTVRVPVVVTGCDKP